MIKLNDVMKEANARYAILKGCDSYTAPELMPKIASMQIRALAETMTNSFNKEIERVHEETSRHIDREMIKFNSKESKEKI